MKTKILLLASLICLFGFTSCKDDNETPPTKWVGGSWKLVKMRVYTTFADPDSGWSKTETTDYSKDNIIYNFQYEKDYKYVDGFWTPKFKLIVHNYIPTGLPDDIQEGGEYFYQFCQPGYANYSSNNAMPPLDAYNLRISSVDDAINYCIWCSANEVRTGVSIDNSTNKMNIGTGYYNQFYDSTTRTTIQWTKYFVKIKDEVQNEK